MSGENRDRPIETRRLSAGFPYPYAILRACYLFFTLLNSSISYRGNSIGNEMVGVDCGLRRMLFCACVLGSSCTKLVRFHMAQFFREYLGRIGWILSCLVGGRLVDRRPCSDTSEAQTRVDCQTSSSNNSNGWRNIISLVIRNRRGSTERTRH